MGQKLSALTFAPDLAASDLFYMAEDIGGGIFFERKVELSQLDSRWVNTSGDTMTGVLDMGGFTIDNLDFPVLGGQAANKAYVDALVGAGAPPFTDTISLVKGSVDTTKLLRFEVDGFTAATTRVLTPQDASYIIAGTDISNTFTVHQEFNDSVNFGATATTIDAAGSYVGPLMEIETKLTVDAPAGTGALVRFNLFNPDVGPGIDMFAILGSGEVLFLDGVRQTFNPDGTTPGLNFGSEAGDPSTPINGDVWYNSTSNKFRARENGVSVDMIGGGGGSPPFIDSTALVMGSADATKLLRFEVDGFTAGVTRVLTPQNADYIIAGTNIANTFSVTQTFTPAVNTSAIIVSGYSLTGSSAVGMIDLAGTWNTSGTPTAIKLNISSNTSNAASLLMDLQAVSLSKFKVSAVGMTTISRVQTNATLNNTDAHLLFDNTSASGQTMVVFQINAAIRGGLRADVAGNFNWHASGSQGHQFYSTNDTSGPICGFSASGIEIGGVAGAVSTARLDVISKATTNIGQILKQFAGQTENMLQVRDSANTVLARLTAGGGFVFNENAADVDTRIEGDTNANLFFTDASTDRVGIGTATPASLLEVNGTLTSGNHTMTVAALLSIISGTNQRAGNAVLVAGTITVNNTTVTANTIVMLTRKTSGGTIGTAITYTVAAGTSFTITSDSVLDTSTFSYFLIEVV